MSWSIDDPGEDDSSACCDEESDASAGFEVAVGVDEEDSHGRDEDGVDGVEEEEGRDVGVTSSPRFRFL